MSTVTFSVVITDSTGATQTATGTAVIDAVTITSSTVNPATAPAGTTRTWTVVASSSSGATLSAGTPSSSQSGVTFTPISGQPAGTFAWTVTGL